MLRWVLVVRISFFISMLLSLLASSQVMAMGLNAALEHTYKYNPDLESSRYNLFSVDENASQAFSEWLPSIIGNYSVGDEHTERGSISSNGDTETIALTVTQPIFNGGSTIAKMQQANYDIDAARAQLLATEKDVLLAAIEAYMDVVRDQEIYSLNINNKKILEEHLEATNQRFALGEVTRTDVAQAQARLAQAIADEAQAKGNLRVSRALFKEVVGLPAGALTLPKKTIKIEAGQDALIDLALQQNPDIQQAKFNELSARQDVSIQKANLFPSVDVQAKTTRNQAAESLFFGTNESETDSITLNLTIPLFQSGSEYSKIRQANYVASKQKFDLKKIQNETRSLLIENIENLKAAQSTITSVESAVEAATVALEGVSKEAKIGSRTVLDVLDAEQELFESKADLIRAQRDEIVYAYMVQGIIGKLTAKELRLNVRYFDSTIHYQKTRYKIIGF